MVPSAGFQSYPLTISILTFYKISLGLKTAHSLSGLVAAGIKSTRSAWIVEFNKKKKKQDCEADHPVRNGDEIMEMQFAV